ncbi:uncharacterized protein N7506_001592 [Penicillium brevicompactum]|uniref:uncharacterized protein n=1 Tax=Penicillium brevicompactum TaxID=5074 RepID=UPI002541ADD5|nr:uncharacterized protein N7506_001592 [Penicillium brevicompactum]KAJ5348339.1 hypothetical protein N7506_001592 [Penicillium brevicompactum]
MAYRPMKEVLESPLFTFQVGPQKKEFVVHSLIIAKLSPALNALINGEWKEASDKRVDWSDVKEGTFLRLCEFAYGKDYTLPAPDLGELSFPKTTHTTTSGASNDDDKSSNGESTHSTFEVDDDMNWDRLGWPHFPSCDFFYLKRLERWGLANAHPNPDWDKNLWGAQMAEISATSPRLSLSKSKSMHWLTNGEWNNCAGLLFSEPMGF